MAPESARHDRPRTESHTESRADDPTARREARRQAALRRLERRRRRGRQRRPDGGGLHRAPAAGPLAARIPVAALTGYLGAGEERLVLRDPDFAAGLRAGRDVDVLVADARSSESELIRSLGVPLWFARHGHVWSYHYEWGQLDLVRSLDVRGLRYLSVAEVFAQRRQAPSGVWTPSPAHDALIAWLTGLLWRGALRPRHRERILRAAEDEPDALMRALDGAVGRHWGHYLWRRAASGRPEAADAAAGTLRRALALRALATRPRASAGGWARYWLAEARLRLSPPVPWVALLGPDGSGTSSVAHALSAALPPCLRRVHHARWRPNALLPSAPATHLVEDPRGQTPYPPLLSLAKLALLTLDWWTGHLLRLSDARARGRLVVFDRCLLDLLADPRRHRYRGPRWAARLAARLAPQPEMVVALTADAATLQPRERDVPAVESARQAAAYDALVRKLKAGYVVDASQPASAVAADVAALIAAYARTRSARRLKLTPYAAPAPPARA